MIFKFDNCGIQKQKIYLTAKKLLAEIKRMNKTRSYDSDFASTHLPFDPIMLESVNACVSMKRKLNPSLIIVTGIGGSNLGTVAIHEAIQGKLWNLSGKPKILFADTVDPDAIAAISNAMKEELCKGSEVLINVISKSGTTTETIANFEVLLNVLKRHRKDAEKYVVAATDRNSKLWLFAEKQGFSLLEIPKRVGGRFSVFSPAGLFPLGMLGLDLAKLLQGAARMREACSVEDVRKNPAAIGAALLYLHSKSKINIYDHFMFAADLESLGKWYRQLLAESIGKEFNVKGKKVNAGMTPTVSIGSTDLHSMAQLYFGGPKDKFTNFVAVNFSNKVHTPSYPEFNSLVANIQKTELAQIMKAIFEGTKRAYVKGKLPFTETRLEFKDEQSIGEFMQFKMIETMLLGKLLNVNPFDQPNVEAYKKETRVLLAK